jgi:hypothetical protein
MTAQSNRPRLIDNDLGEISVTINGKEVRGWSYQNDPERRIKMLLAREYVEGWFDGYKLGMDAVVQMIDDNISAPSSVQ